MEQEYLFVYGTLRKDFDLDLKKSVKELLHYVGTGTIKAVLFDLGAYPGAVRTLEESSVIGDVFSVSNPSKVFTVLDNYEGEEYNREKETIQMHSGTTLSAWCYWYIGSSQSIIRITENDYLNYLKNKKTV